MRKLFALLVIGILAGTLANNASSTKPVVTPVPEPAPPADPIPSIRGMYCNTPCTGVSASDHHLGELAVLVIYRKQCFNEPQAALDYQFSVAWDEWNQTPIDAKRAALAH